MTCFVKDNSSYSILFETLRLGNSGSLWEGHLVMNNFCDIVKILGVYFGGDAEKKRRTELLEDSGIN